MRPDGVATGGADVAGMTVGSAACRKKTTATMTTTAAAAVIATGHRGLSVGR
jgi:hypothetical protein